MQLSDRIRRKSDQELIELAENHESFTVAARKLALAEIELRQLAPAYIQAIAEDFNRDLMRKRLDTFDVFTEVFLIPRSNFLTPEQMKNLLKEEFEAMMKDREGFRFDVMQYAMGG